jgi:hypothetical protein
MQHPRIGHDAAKSPVTFREMRTGTKYRHYKGGLYEVVGTRLIEATLKS